MKWLCIVLLLCAIFLVLLLQGCSGTGFEKKATVMPNSVSISYLQERFHDDSAAWRGGSISATWEFK